MRSAAVRDVMATIRTNDDGTLIPWNRSEIVWHACPVRLAAPSRNVPIELQKAAQVLREQHTFGTQGYREGRTPES